MLKTLISAEELLQQERTGRAAVVIDASFDLADESAGLRSWQQSQVPGSVYLHLDHDLAGAKTGRNGRHPLPDREAFARLLGTIGVGPETPVVALDRQGGVYAARVWWLLRWMGHADVAVLDGGLGAWLKAGGTAASVDSEGRSAPAASAPAGPPGRGGAEATSPRGSLSAPPTTTAPSADLTEAATALPSPARGTPVAPPYSDRPPLTRQVEADEVAARLGRGRIVDARAPERFRGEVEPLDAVAGHIPGASHRFFRANLGADGRFKSAEQLRSEFIVLLGADPPAGVVHQCGSGVTACHNLLAMEHAGLPGSALYPGSWSEWSADPQRPVARG
jgi:thiosulfate/3-mercaptopyruvate sulfurtransferase